MKTNLKNISGKKSLQTLPMHTNVCWTTNSIEEGITNKIWIWVENEKYVFKISQKSSKSVEHWKIE